MRALTPPLRRLIVFHLGRLEVLRASPGDTEGDGKTGRGTEQRFRLGAEDPWPIYHDALLCGSGSEVNLPHPNCVTHTEAEMCTEVLRFNHFFFIYKLNVSAHPHMNSHQY